MLTSVMPIYQRSDVIFVRGSGPYLFDINDNRYLDFVSGVATTCLGHAHPRLIEALHHQAQKLWHVSNLFYIEDQERLAQRLVDHSFAESVFFTNSGVEAWECGIKLIRKHYSQRGQSERYRILTFDGCFHGRTLAAIAASKQEKMIHGFGPMMDGFDQVALNDLDALRAAIMPQTAGIVVEPIQGDGGVRVCHRGFLRELRQIADEYGLLFMVDEIQCGMGRTGRLFAYEEEDISPDVMCIAKGIGGGFPLGACLATQDAAIGMTLGTHGSTFGGNPLATAVGNTVLDEILTPGFLENVTHNAHDLHHQLSVIVARYPHIFKDVRGVGLLVGLGCRIPSTTMIDRLQSFHLLTAPAAENVVRLLPPLNIGPEHIKEACETIDQAAQSLAEEN